MDVKHRRDGTSMDVPVLPVAGVMPHGTKCKGRTPHPQRVVGGVVAVIQETLQSMNGRIESIATMLPYPMLVPMAKVTFQFRRGSVGLTWPSRLVLVVVWTVLIMSQ